nr:outer membrane beta-barrel protein [Kofleriaceae bacterium]
DCNSSGASEAGGLALRAGVMVQPNLAVALDLSGMAHREDRVKTSQTLAAITARGWLAPRLWLEGGVGIARSSAEYDLTVVNVVDESENVLGGLVGVGFEVISSRNLALDVGLRGATSFYRNDVRLYNVALTVGVSFF